MGEKKAVTIEGIYDLAFVIARRRGASVPDAEDLAQETILKILNQPELLSEPPSRVVAWVRRVVTNRKIDLQRRQQTHNRAEPKMEMGPMNAPTSDPWVRKTLNKKVPERELMAAFMKDVLNMNRPEIAKHMGVSVSTVRNLLHDFRQRARDLFGDENPKGGAS